MINLLARLRQKCAIGFVGGSNLVKQEEQLGTPESSVTSMFDFCFAENGLTAYKLGDELPSSSFIGWLGEEPYKELVRFMLHYIADLEINVSPIGRNAGTQERNDYEKYDKEHHVREKFIEQLRERFGHLGLS
jgi:phosphomannomutase